MILAAVGAFQSREPDAIALSVPIGQLQPADLAGPKSAVIHDAKERRITRMVNHAEEGLQLLLGEILDRFFLPRLPFPSSCALKRSQEFVQLRQPFGIELGDITALCCLFMVSGHVIYSPLSRWSFAARRLIDFFA